MKQIITFVSIVTLMVLAFFLGRVTHPSNNEVVQEDSDMTIQKNGILAYQHYYEVAEDMLKTESPDSILLADYESAKMQLDDYKARHVMMWPEICDQRDMLSDAIRCFYDHHPKLRNNREDNIMAYVRDFGINPDILGEWSFSY